MLMYFRTSWAEVQFDDTTFRLFADDNMALHQRLENRIIKIMNVDLSRVEKDSREFWRRESALQHAREDIGNFYINLIFEYLGGRGEVYSKIKADDTFMAEAAWQLFRALGEYQQRHQFPRVCYHCDSTVQIVINVMLTMVHELLFFMINGSRENRGLEGSNHVCTVIGAMAKLVLLVVEEHTQVDTKADVTDELELGRMVVTANLKLQETTRDQSDFDADLTMEKLNHKPTIEHLQPIHVLAMFLPRMVRSYNDLETSLGEYIEGQFYAPEEEPEEEEGCFMIRGNLDVGMHIQTDNSINKFCQLKWDEEWRLPCILFESGDWLGPLLKQMKSGKELTKMHLMSTLTLDLDESDEMASSNFGCFRYLALVNSILLLADACYSNDIEPYRRLVRKISRSNSLWTKELRVACSDLGTVFCRILPDPNGGEDPWILCGFAVVTSHGHTDRALGDLDKLYIDIENVLGKDESTFVLTRLLRRYLDPMDDEGVPRTLRANPRNHSQSLMGTTLVTF
mmetsp:Transcript_24024/g.59671  ORF Transcript_24024/g.59671 Transcript_24024/m.59671 type:complete len:512 (+) Transcript_24024:3-1538(+)